MRRRSRHYVASVSSEARVLAIKQERIGTKCQYGADRPIYQRHVKPWAHGRETGSTALVVKPEFDSPNCLHSALVDYTNQSGLGQMGLERWLDIPAAASGNFMPCERPGLNQFFFVFSVAPGSASLIC